MIIPQCFDCRHYQGKRAGGGYACAAYPASGPEPIPDAILMGEHDHKKPYPGDHGIRFELAEGLDGPAEGSDTTP